MNKTALKNVAARAKKELLQKVEAKALGLGIAAEGMREEKPRYADGKRKKLMKRIQDLGFRRVVEDIACAWFIRFAALRFMEVNNCLPAAGKVLPSGGSGDADPELSEVQFQCAVIGHCRSLSVYLPFMFEALDDEKEILFPEGLPAGDSFLRELTDPANIPESDWKQVEINGCSPAPLSSQSQNKRADRRGRRYPGRINYFR